MTRSVRVAGRQVDVPARADQPGEALDAELRLLFRKLPDPPAGPCLEVGAWDAGLALAADASGWRLHGTLVPLNLGAAAGIAAGVAGDPAWRVCPAGTSAGAHASAVLRASHWLGRAGVEWCLREAAQALPPGGRLYLAGDRARGVASQRRTAAALIGPEIDRAVGEHRRLHVFERDDRPLAPQAFRWSARAALGGRELTIHHHPTVFSPGRVDPMTALLAGRLPERGGRWLDMGCGNGALAAWAAAGSDRQVTAIDWAYLAIETAKATLAANAAAADVAAADGRPPSDEKFDVVTCFPPFHVGATVDHAPARRLLDAARAALAPAGELWVVLTSAQSSARLLRGIFSDVTAVAETGGARVYRCRDVRRRSTVRA